MAKGVQLAFKHALDLGVALIGLILLALPFAPIALLIKLDSKGPVFFRPGSYTAESMIQHDLARICRADRQAILLQLVLPGSFVIHSAR